MLMFFFISKLLFNIFLNTNELLKEFNYVKNIHIEKDISLKTGILFCISPISILKNKYWQFLNYFNKHLYDNCKNKTLKEIKLNIKTGLKYTLIEKKILDEPYYYDLFFSRENCEKYYECETYKNIKSKINLPKLKYYEMIVIDNNTKTHISINSCGIIFEVFEISNKKYEDMKYLNEYLFKKLPYE